MLKQLYNPQTGRFISSDGTVGDVGNVHSMNLYAYCNNNPINFSDESGCWPSWATQLLVGVAVIAVLAVVVVATGGFGAAGCCLAKSMFFGAVKGAIIGAIQGAVMGAVIGAVVGGITTGTWEGAWKAATSGGIDGAASGFMFGAILGAISGAVNSKYCFIAGTLVLTDQGLKAIDTLKVGDKVYSEDTETGMKAYKEVVQVFENETDELYHITVDEEIITTTKGHPFYVKGKGWTNASELKAGDELLIKEGRYGKIVYIEVEQLQKKVKTYNLEVEGYHTYYVGEKEVLVHNTCADGKEKHHVVEQCQIKRSNLDKNLVNKNTTYIDKGVHRNISRLYSSKGKLDGVNHLSELGINAEGKVLRNWMNGKKFDEQLEIGKKILDYFSSPK